MALRLNQPNKILTFKNFTFDFSKKTCLMAVLNVTPDSFSDGGLFLRREKAIEKALQMVRDGADIIDVGGESTRPGAIPVSLDEELRRVIPVIESLASEINVPVSIDTSKPIVAREAVKAGASIINDIMGSDLDKKMAWAAAELDVPLVLMHIKGTPRTMQNEPVYQDLMAEIISALAASIKIAEACGVSSEKIIVDPGIGFGKTAAHNFELLRRLKELEVLGKPILVGPSRKSFIGAALGIEDPGGRLMGTAAAAAIAIANGANIVRVHDVKEIGQVIALADAVHKR